MQLYPAIDLRGGRCVRLYQGSYDAETAYSDDPVGQAQQFADAGASWLHVVDLDAARTGDPVNLAVIAAIADAVDVPVQTGGGVRSLDAAAALADAGVARVVIGTAAVETPELVEQVAAHQPVAVGLDARGREVATHGWEQGGGGDLLELAARFESSGAEAVVVTEISRDGTMSGPDTDGLAAVLDATGLAVIASGGVATLPDLTALAAIGDHSRRLAGVIVGRALYEGRFSVEQALETLSS
ncbi:MAG: 1-(5-phosphoribosyl)-5-[(5-phosphoribosylamino)methylideneamino]imidazole-4-carboxamide isomerase [Acidimicrobiia bacterium]|nr:1-(5-phosphoribosyl)-5-[(5-phosphoribosylamino)methylideneamino]imidazole-4-carboxamide isomerase [Acidimicrobiia bacterium]MXW58637.1 1-(5-phosphoribosyl)-5-[(5-phosphoribosylamino)methylideneamino]imidazole-4-carboxamide isomerase [Acidimicrobiia bacterium]MYB75326.1 1-(5-phosphoribosyl)-5-[(5-phosphoribosylamino)methylideneamino]imidazole-4-carboxamide isomerase [Acidimicrobiia bacterium]MYH95639.1 1-(5-phosphoribosyl)-5-[(5-phosphoribosylamino)methylideneamino]imidazole-4-carboxamide isom